MTIRDIAISFGYEVDKASEKKANSSIQSLKSTATKLLGAIGIGFSLVKLKDLAEEFNGINDQIRDATRGMGEQADIQQTILDMANEARQSYGDMADSVGKLARNTDVFAGVEDAAGFAGLLYKNFMATGKSADESHALVQKMTTAISKGAVDSQAMMSMFKESPGTLRMMADSLGVTVDALQDMVSQGQVSATTLKNVFEQNAGAIEDRFGELDYSISDAMLNIRNQWGLFVDETNSLLGITQTIAKVMVKGFNRVMSVIRKLRDGFEKLANKVGGVERLMKLLTIVAGAIFLALNADKILGFVKALGKGLGGINKKMLLIVAVVVIIALLIEDFINFMQGNDSLIGSLFEKAGIDADAARETILKAWQTIKDFLLKAWETIKAIATAVWGKLKEFWAENGDSIKKSLLSIWESIKTVLSALWEALKAIATSVFNALRKFWDAWGDKIMNTFSILWEGIKTLFMTVLNIITSIFSAFAALFSGDWEGLWNSVKNILSSIWDAIVTIVTTVLNVLWTLFGDILTNIWNKVVEVFTNIKTAITDKVTSIKDTIVDGFTAAIDWIKALPAQALQWGKDIITGIVDGIKSMISAVGDAVKGVADKIKSFLHFSVPDEGPLTDYESWMPDFMEGLAKGIAGAKDKVADAMKGVTGDIAIAANASLDSSGGIFQMLKDIASLGMTPRAETVSASTSSVESKAVTQNVQITNQFNGDRAGQQKSAEAMDKAADDATGVMARGLAYVR